MSSPVRREMPFQGMPQPGRTVEVQPGQTREVNVGGYIAFETTTQGVGSSLERLNSLNLSINFQSNFSQIPNPEFTTVFLEDDQGQITRLFGYGRNSAAPGAWRALTDNRKSYNITISDSFVIGKSFTYSHESGRETGTITTGRIRKITVVDYNRTVTSSLPVSDVVDRYLEQSTFSSTEMQIHRAIGTRDFIARFRQMPGFQVFPFSGPVDFKFWHDESTMRGLRRPDPSKFTQIGGIYIPRFFMIPPVAATGSSLGGIPSEHMVTDIIHSSAGYSDWSMQLSGYFAYDQIHRVLNFIGIVQDPSITSPTCKIIAHTIRNNDVPAIFLPGTHTPNKESLLWQEIMFGSALYLNSTEVAQVNGGIEDLSRNQGLLTQVKKELSQRTRVGKFSN